MGKIEVRVAHFNLNIVKLLIGAIGLLFIVTGCGFMDANVSSITKPVEEVISISGSVAGDILTNEKLTGLKSSATRANASCTRTVKLFTYLSYLKYKNGENISPLGTTTVQSDSTFTFTNIKGKGFSSISNFNDAYIVVFSNCNKELARIVDSEANQSITNSYNKVFEVISQANLNQTSLDPQLDESASSHAFSIEKLRKVYDLIPAAATESQTINLIKSSSDVKSNFQDLLERDITEISNMSPIVFNISTPALLGEKSSYTFSISEPIAWDSDGNYIYEWSLDNLTFGHLNTIEYITGANHQGTHTVSVKVGFDNGSGQLDANRPQTIIEKQFIVTDTSPARPPNVMGANTNPASVSTQIITQNNTVIQVNNGASISGGFESCDTFSKYTMTVDNSVKPTMMSEFTRTCSESIQTIPVVFASEGLHTLRFWSVDAIGNVSESANSLKFIYDPTAPTLAFSAPDAVAGNSVSNFIVSAIDPSSGLASLKVEVSTNGTDFTVAFNKIFGAATFTANEIVNINWPKVDTANAFLRLTATDLAGNTATKLSNPISIDSTAPTIQFLNPPTGAIAGGRIFNIQWSADDANLLAARITISFSQDDGKTWASLGTMANVGSFNWSPPLINISTARLKLVIQDSTGNEASTTTPSSFSIDSIAPTKPKVILTTPLESSSTLLTFSNQDCSDKKYLIVKETNQQPSASDTGWKDCKEGTSAIEYTLADSTIGYRPLYIWAKDNAGNLSPSKIIPFTFAPRLILGTTLTDKLLKYEGGIKNPNKLFFFGNSLVATDECRVLFWNSVPTMNRQVPSFYLGLPHNDYQTCNPNGINAKALFGPTGIAYDGTHFVVADADNNRVLIYNTLPSTADAVPDLVLGQLDFDSSVENFEGITARTMKRPSGVAINNGKLYVADSDNNRVLIWNTFPTENAKAADVVLGQPTFTTNSENIGSVTASTLNFPRSFVFLSGKMFLADAENHRILIWNTIPTTNQAPADIVLGQPSMTASTTNNGGASERTMNNPRSISTDGTHFIVADGDNNRVLIWNTIPTQNQQAADVVVGQTVFSGISANQSVNPSASTLSLPVDAAIDKNGQLWITDYDNHRIVKFSTLPTTNGASADLVLGQNLLANQNGPYSTGVTASNFRIVNQVITHNGNTYIVDAGNRRILRYNTIVSSAATPPTEVFGQDNLTSMLANKGNTTPSDTTLGSDTRDILFVGTKMFVTDYSNNRVLGWSQFNDSFSSPPDIVLGQPTFTTNTANNGGSSASAMYGPNRLATNGTVLAVSDFANHRVLIWNTIPTSNFKPADVVIGQPDMVSRTRNNGGISAKTLYAPDGLLFVANKLLVVDKFNNRVLIWNSVPTQNFQPADVVIGQMDMVSSQIFGTGLTSTGGLDYPVAIEALPSGKIAISERSSIKIWNSIPTTNGVEPDQIIAGYNHWRALDDPQSPVINERTTGVASRLFFDGSRLFVGSPFEDRAMIFALPDVSLATLPFSSSRNVAVTMHNCYNYTKVLVNEGSQPTTSDSQWKTCSTTKASYPYTVTGTEGYHNLKVWFMDDDGFVLPQNRNLDFYLDRIAPVKPSIETVSAAFNTTSIQLKARTCNGIYQVLISESSTPPDSNSSAWQSCATDSMPATLSSLVDGPHTLYVWARDSAGNISSRPTAVTVNIDITPPTMAPAATITRQYLGSFSTLYLTMNNCTDASYILLNESTRPDASDSAWVACSTTSNFMSYNVSYPTSGTHNFKFWSKDAAGNVSSSPYIITKNYEALLVMGQNNFTQIASAATSFTSPNGLSSDGTRVVIADTINARILLWNSIPTANNTPADIVLGQPDNLTIGTPSFAVTAVNKPSASSLSKPYDALIVGGKIIVPDYNLNRVLIWNSIPTTNGKAADVVLGQPGFDSLTYNNGGLTAKTMGAPIGVASDGTRLVVTEYGNSRILIWNTIPTVNQTPADVVLGQPDFSSGTVNNGGLSAQSLNRPRGVRIKDGRLYVADSANNRILIWNSIPTVNNAPADVVLGQTSFTTSTANTTANGLRTPLALEVRGTQLYVADTSNYRILVWDTLPTTNGIAADRVLGQTNFTTATGTCTGTSVVGGPNGIGFVGNALWTATSCYMIHIWNSAPTATNQNFDSLLWNGLNSGLPTQPWVYDATTLGTPWSVTFSNDNRMFVSDVFSNRILAWNSVPSTSNVLPDFALGQNTLTSVTGNNSNILNAGYLKNPYGIQASNGKFFVADYSNNRVLIYNSTPTIMGQSADLVLGQTNFSGISGNRGSTVAANTLYGPTGVHYDGTRLFVADKNNNRVLIWNSLPTSNGQAADVVLGQSLFTTNTANNGGVSASAMSAPYAVVSYGTSLYVVDTTNNRVLKWNSIPTTNNAPADVVIGQANFTSVTAGTSITTFYNPTGIDIAPNGRIYIADYRNHRVVYLNSSPTANMPTFDGLIGHAIAGSGTPNDWGLTPWSLDEPRTIKVDPRNSTLWIMDTSNHRLLNVNPGN